MKNLRLHLTVLLVLLSATANVLLAQSATVSITANPETAAPDFTVPFSVNNNAVNESIYTSGEIGAATFGINPINHIDYLATQIGENPVFNNVKIYMKNIPAATTVFSGNATYSTAGYTLVYSGSMIYSDTGFSGVNITPFFYDGTGNLQIMVERTDNKSHPGSTFRTAQGNNFSISSLSVRKYFALPALPITASTVLAPSIARPAVRLSYIAPSSPPICATGFVPSDGAANQPTNPVLAWSTAPGATSYDIFLSTTTPATFVKNITSFNYTVTTPLLPFTKYYYKIVAKNSFGGAIGCSEQSFTTGSALKYCIPTYNFSNGCLLGDIISLVKLGTINNSSLCGKESTNEGKLPYTDYSPTISTNLVQGFIYPITINQGYSDDYVKVWIDFDNNGSFEEDGELVFGTGTDVNFGQNISGTISIPANAVLGNHRMRVRSQGVLGSEFSSCGQLNYGEAEDYTVNIKEPSAVDAGITDINVSACQGSGTINVTVKNQGGTAIAGGAVTVKVYINGANAQGPFSLTNTGQLAPNGSTILSFNANFPLLGNNIDSAFIQQLGGDDNLANDSIKTNHKTVAVINAPMTEDFEGNTDGWVESSINGTDSWKTDSSVAYTGFNPPYTLLAKSGRKLKLFESLKRGNIARLASPCINIPASANTGCGYIAGFYMTQDAQVIFDYVDSVVVRIKLGGSSAYTRLGKLNRVDTALSPTYSQANRSEPIWKLYTFDVAAYAGQVVQFAFDAYASGGVFGTNPLAIDSFFVAPKTTVRSTSLAGSNESGLPLTKSITACDDKGWTYYSAPNSAVYLFGIQWDPSLSGANAAAKAAATAKLFVDRKWYAAENVAGLKATYSLQRYWDVNLNSTSLTGPVNVRFFYSQRELDSIILAKNNFIAGNPGSVDKGLFWFKKNTGAFVPATSVTADGISNATNLVNSNTTGLKINGILYAQFDGITSFSGGTAAAGVGLATTNTTYTFTGTGNWNVAANWSNNTIPPNPLPSGSSIVINHAAAGQCILNVAQTIAAGASVTVPTGKNLIVAGNLIIQ
jgi:hypothetical protein